MKITTNYNIYTNYNSNNTNFKSFKIAYGADEKLFVLLSKPSTRSTLRRIYNIGKQCESTHYYDLEMLPDLSLRIKKKGCFSEMLAGPLTVDMPKKPSTKLEIKGKYDGVSTGDYKCGDDYKKYIEYGSYEETLKGYKRIMDANDRITKIYYVLKELEEEAKRKEANEIKELTLEGNIPLDEVLIKRYGDFVKEYK